MSGDRPLTEAALMRRATAYLSRRAASAASVKAVLLRALQRRHRATGEDDRDRGAEEAAVESVLNRLRGAGLLDDAAFARAKAGSLARKGKPAAVIGAELRHRHGVEPADDPALVESLAELDPLAQATRWAERKRLGPFRVAGREDRRDRDIAALARAGFSVSVAKAVVDGDGTVPAS